MHLKQNRLRFLLLPYWIMCFGILSAQSNGTQPRTIIDISKGWSFTKAAYSVSDATANGKIDWQPVDLPHTWNVADVMDDEPGYYRGSCFYKKKVSVPASLQSKDIFIKFEGANQYTEVYINGKKAGSHTGGYAAFLLPINAFLNWDNKAENEIVVKVDNRFNEAIPPLTADFTFYGGIYRTASLVACNKTHFLQDSYGSDGVFISTPSVSALQAKINIKGVVKNSVKKKLLLLTTLLDSAQQIVSETKTYLPATTQINTSFFQDIEPVKTPVLWMPARPYLYKAVTQIKDAATGQILDEIVNPIGFRWFRFDADKGFFLNDKPYKLIGTSRHQDYEGLGNAVPQKLAIQDVKLIKEMGGNFLRVAHYPQDQCILNACDSLGILASVEIPVVNEITESETFYQNCKNMQLEMIKQNYNHPSVIMWCCMNEVLLKPHFSNGSERQKQYFANIKKLAQSLDSIARTEDPNRATMVACHGDFDKYKNAGLTAIPTVVGWNLYSGWYGANLEELANFLDRHHTALPNKPLLITEYGADADYRIRSLHPQRFDKSSEYAVSFHQYYMQQVMQRPFVAGAIIWNLADFNSESREESMPHINTKGLLTWDRKPKDVYRFYQAFLNHQPYTGSAIKEDTSQLQINEMTVGEQVNFLLGAQRFFYDPLSKQCWQPCPIYQPGTWGYTGGRPYKQPNNNRLPYGTDKNITGTDNDPIYQTQQTGIEKLFLNVPNGRYQLDLHFAELSNIAAQALVYNLTKEADKTTQTQRIFDVYANDSLVLPHFNIAIDYGVAKAVVKTVVVNATADKGITLSFKAITGEPVLNALQVKRLN